MGEQENNEVIVEPTIPPVRRQYTEIVGATNNPCIVRLLKFLMSSRVSEMTAVNQYIFQHLIIDGVNDELARTLREISIQEMRHLELLGEAIIKFGGVPKFSNGQGTPWSARNINYNQNVNQFLNSNIRGEELSIRNYEQAISCVDNESLKQLFREIIEDERRHIEIFRSFIN